MMEEQKDDGRRWKVFDEKRISDKAGRIRWKVMERVRKRDI